MQSIISSHGHDLSKIEVYPEFWISFFKSYCFVLHQCETCYFFLDLFAKIAIKLGVAFD